MVVIARLQLLAFDARQVATPLHLAGKSDGLLSMALAVVVVTFGDLERNCNRVLMEQIQPTRLLNI